MVFSSNIFLLYFLPAFLVLYFVTPNRFRNYTLLLASLIFYAYGAPDFIIQLTASTILNFFLVKFMCKAEKQSVRKLFCGISIFVSLGLLAYYKYGNFTMENINAIESPFPNKSFIISLFSLKSSFPGRRSLHFVSRYTEHMMQENTWDKTVASPAPNTPK